VRPFGVFGARGLELAMPTSGAPMSLLMDEADVVIPP
jgi:hypothetical protein